jgi:hypothetical protein
MKSKVLIFLCTLAIAGCESFPVRQMGETQIKSPYFQKSLSVEEQVQLNLKKIKRVALTIGLKERSCGAYTFSGHDISSRALSHGSRLLGTNNQNAHCFEMCLDKSMTYMQDAKQCLEARAVAQIDPFDPQLVKVEMWTPAPTKESELVTQKLELLMKDLRK